MNHTEICGKKFHKEKKTLFCDSETYSLSLQVTTTAIKV